MTFATTRNTNTLYTVAYRERDSRSYVTVACVVSERHAIDRIAHHGVPHRDASALVRAAAESAQAELANVRSAQPSMSAELAIEPAHHGDMHEHVELGPRGESFRVIATVVCAPGMPVA
jgi:hypothetical protein